MSQTPAEFNSRQSPRFWELGRAKAAAFAEHLEQFSADEAASARAWARYLELQSQQDAEAR